MHCPASDPGAVAALLVSSELLGSILNNWSLPLVTRRFWLLPAGYGLFPVCCLASLAWAVSLPLSPICCE